MDGNPYSRYTSRELTLADHLAIDRTILANERTLLSYLRTALGLAVIGGTVLKFFDSWWMIGLAIGFMLAAGAAASLGWRRYRRTRRRLAAALERRTGAPEHPLKGEGGASGATAPSASPSSASAATTTESPVSPPPR